MEDNNKYSFKQYDPIYPKLFKLEEALLRKALPKNIRIEHVGSTAVPGLGGKGIIDIAIAVPEKEVGEYIVKLEKLGYEYKPHPGDEQRKFMQKIITEKGKERRVHLHLTWEKTGFWESFLAFRNYLRTNTKARDNYSRIKRAAAKHADGGGVVYNAYKSEAVSKIVREAMKRR